MNDEFSTSRETELLYILVIERSQWGWECTEKIRGEIPKIKSSDPIYESYLFSKKIRSYDCRNPSRASTSSLDIFSHIFFRFHRSFFSCEKNAWQFNFELSCCCCKLSSFNSRWFSDFRFLCELDILWESERGANKTEKSCLISEVLISFCFMLSRMILCFSNFLITLFYDRSLWGFMAATQWYTRK